jgi:hypothetical protein
MANGNLWRTRVTRWATERAIHRSRTLLSVAESETSASRRSHSRSGTATARHPYLLSRAPREHGYTFVEPL